MKISSKNLISINLWLLIIVFIGILVINGLGIEFSYAQGSCASPPPGPEIRFFEEFYETTCEAEDLGGVCPCPEKRNEAYVTVYAVYKYVCLSGEWEYERDRFDFEIVQQCPEGGSGGGEAGCGDCTLYYEDPAPEGCGWVRPPSTSCVNPGLCAIRATYDCVNDSTWEDTGCICEGGGGGPPPPPPPSVDLLGPATVEIPNPIILSWNSSNTDSCSASGDWSGSKPTSGSETLNLPGGTYTFTLSCSGPGGSSSDSVTIQVIQVPQCTFWADPANIIIPQVSNLRWTCQYADSCSINQGVGFVCATETECSADLTPVRPKQTTVYDLTCSGLDGSRFYDTTVNVGFIPRLKEILPKLNFLNIEFLKT